MQFGNKSSELNAAKIFVSVSQFFMVDGKMIDYIVMNSLSQGRRELLEAQGRYCEMRPTVS